MDILLLETNLREIDAVRQALTGTADTLIPVGSSDRAWAELQQGDIQFLIVDLDHSDAAEQQLIRRIREVKPKKPIYILLITSDVTRVNPDVDDTLFRPYIEPDLKNRILIAERILALNDKILTLQDQFENQAAFDVLTGFMNRAGFLRQAAGELERSRRASLSLSLVALDIDNLKEIHDRFGSKVGDDVLNVMAGVIREKSRPYDCIGRWAGDEFVLALPGVIGADAEKVAERILAGVYGTRIEVPNEPPLNVMVSAGIASILRISSNTEIEPIILAAREAVTRAKEAGGNQVFLVFM